MSDDRVTPRLGRLNRQDLRDLLGSVLEDRAHRMLQHRLVDAPRAQGDTLSGRVRQQSNRNIIARVQVRLPDWHVSQALTLDVQCDCGQPVLCEHAAVLLATWAFQRQSFTIAAHAHDVAPTMPRLPDDALWHGLRGPAGYLAPLLSLQRVGEVRKIAKRLPISSEITQKDVLIREIHAARPRADMLRAQLDALSPFQRALLQLLVLRDTPLWFGNLEKMNERLKLSDEASIDDALKHLASMGLAFATESLPSRMITWQVPIDLIPHITVDMQALQLDQRARADATNVSPSPSPPLTAAAALHGLRVALEARHVQRLSRSMSTSKTHSIDGLKGWRMDADELAQVRGKPWQWLRDPERAFTVLPPDPLLSDSDLATLADGIGGTPDLVRFLLRTLQTLGLVTTTNRRVQLLDATERLLSRAAHDQARLLAATWAWDTSWSEVDDLEGVIVRRRYGATLWWQPEHLYAELAAVRRFLMRLLRALEPGCWYSVSGFVSLAFAVQPRLLYEQRTVNLADGSRDAWWVARPDGQRLDPRTPADWRHVEERLITQIVRGPLCWLGLLEPGTAADDTPLFRITPLGEYLLGQRSDYQPAPRDPGLHITADAAQQQITIQVALPESDAATLTQVAQVADAQGLTKGTLTYRITPQRLRDAMQRGQTIDAIRQFLKASTKKRLPAAVRDLLAGWEHTFGQSVLYEGVALIELSDDLLLPELLRATRLDAALLEQLSPRLLVVDPAHADKLFMELVTKGYTPRRITVKQEEPRNE
jgi:hypothetical protein